MNSILFYMSLVLTEAAKNDFLLVDSPLRPLAPPPRPRLSGQKKRQQIKKTNIEKKFFFLIE